MAIKVAVLSDIHGNIIALDEVLKDAKCEKIDKYIVSGDLVNELPFGNDVIERLEQIDAYSIKGNKEEYLIEYEKKKYNWNNLQFLNTIFMYEELSSKSWEYIKNLKEELNLKFENVNIKVVHGSPESITELIHKEDTDKIDKYTKDLKEDLLILGHTHQKIWEYEINGKTVVNAGCLGVSPENIGFAEYIILHVEDDKFHIEKRLVKFDTEKLKNKIAKSQILEKEKTFMNLIYLQLTGKPEVKSEFFIKAKEKMLEKKRKLYKEDADGIYKYFKMYDDDIWLELTNEYRKHFIF